NACIMALRPLRELRGTGLSSTLLAVACEPAVDALEFLPTVAGVCEVTLYGTLLHVLVEDHFSADALAAALRAKGIAVTSVREIKPSLEDVFVSRIRSSI